MVKQLTAATARRAISSTTLAFSNMMGPLEDVSFYGHQLTYLAPSVYGHPHVSYLILKKLSLSLSLSANMCKR